MYKLSLSSLTQIVAYKNSAERRHRFKNNDYCNCYAVFLGSDEKSAYNWEAAEKYEMPPLEEFRPKYEGHGWKMLIR